MNSLLREALVALANLDTTLKPVPLANARESALIMGLNGLAAEYGREIQYTRIDTRGEMDFVIKGGSWGPELAAWLGTIPVRTGLAAYQGPQLPENGWCHIHHFDVERLLQRVGREMGVYPAEPAPVHAKVATTVVHDGP